MLSLNIVHMKICPVLYMYKINEKQICPSAILMFTFRKTSLHLKVNVYNMCSQL